MTYKSSKLYGFAENKENSMAKTVLEFLILSVFRNFKEIVCLHPVVDLMHDDINTLTTNVCNLIIRCGFKLLVITTNNNRINRNLLQNEQWSTSKEYIICIPEDQINTYLTFDSVHIMKCVRNNWINLKSYILWP